jgi:hypothetical protein
MTRRAVLLSLLGVLAAPRAARAAPAMPEETVIVGGWILRASDLVKAAARAA